MVAEYIEALANQFGGKSKENNKSETQHLANYLYHCSLIVKHDEENATYYHPFGGDGTRFVQKTSELRRTSRKHLLFRQWQSLDYR
jgi:hypothetical protein